MSSSFFIRWRKEKERIKNVVALLNFWNSFVVGCRFLRWSRRAVSVLAPRPGCRKNDEWTRSSWSARLVSDRIMAGSYWKLCVLAFFAANIKQRAQRCSMTVLISGVDRLRSYRMLVLRLLLLLSSSSIDGLGIGIFLASQASLWNSRSDLSCWWLPESSRHPYPSGLMDCLFKGRLPIVVGVYDFLLAGRTHI